MQGDYAILVLDLLGLNLEDLLTLCASKLSLRSVLMFADQAVP